MNRTRVLASRIAATSLVVVTALPASGTSANENEERMNWWREAKFGMFVHWGVYAVPAGEYRGRTVDGPSEWIQHAAGIPAEEYESFAARFDPVRYDARAWARIARAGGMRYLVITSKHHDGFSMYGTRVDRYNVVESTPLARDPLVELASACRSEGIRFGVYYSILDWHVPSQTGAGKTAYVASMKAQLAELVELLQPDILWFDGDWEPWWTREDADDLERYVRGIAPGAILNNRVGKRTSADGDFDTPEQGIPRASSCGRAWETCMTLNDSWGYKEKDSNWKPPRAIVRNLIEIAAKGGNYLLNVGPTSQGEIPAESVRILGEVGDWLEVHGEAIYGTTGFFAAPWGGVTRKGTRLFVLVAEPPPAGTPLLVPLLSPVASSTARCEPAGGEGLYVYLPDEIDPVATVVTIDVAGEPERKETGAELTAAGLPIPASPDGTITLWAQDAALVGGAIQLEDQHPNGNVGYWTSVEDHVGWFVELPAGDYDVELTYACAPGAGGNFEIRLGDRALLVAEVGSTGAWNQFETVRLGRIAASPGKASLTVRPRVFTTALMNLASLRLVPAAPK